MAKRINKKTKRSTDTNTKNTIRIEKSTDNHTIVWKYDRIDRSGKFAFNLSRDDFNHKDFLDKMIQYSNMTWIEVKRQTHDDGRSKHHFISADDLSKTAQERFFALHLEEYSDTIFSFAFQNKLRILGIRENEQFHVVWYDPYHEVCPSKKRHT